MKEIPIVRRVLERNEQVASEVRKLLSDENVVMLNLIGGPGAGKTTLLQSTISGLRGIRAGVIEGDIATTTDAEKMDALGIPVVQIETAGSCHLESSWVLSALKKLPLDEIDLVFVENVGNLVCPTAFDLGEHAKIGVLSVTEGDDKPRKYPQLFSLAKAIVLTKIDMLKYFNFDEDNFISDIKRLGNMPVFKVNSLSGEGISAWISWLEGFMKEVNG